jgi:transposase
MRTNENRVRYDRSKLRYPSDLTDAEWALIGPLIPAAKRGRNKRSVVVRDVVNGVMFILSTGCQWASLPKELPPRSTVNDYFCHWDWDGTLERIHHALHVRCWRRGGGITARCGRTPRWVAGTEKRRSTEPRNTVTMAVTATQGFTYDWREVEAQVRDHRGGRRRAQTARWKSARSRGRSSGLLAHSVYKTIRDTRPAMIVSATSTAWTDARSRAPRTRSCRDR